MQKWTQNRKNCKKEWRILHFAFLVGGGVLCKISQKEIFLAVFGVGYG